jgi:hypothetical protein
MNVVEAKAIADRSWHNRHRLTPGTACGCFYCRATFPAEDVQFRVDDGLTALCPRCGIDSVLPGVTDPETLAALRHHRFDATYRMTEDEERKAPAEHAAGE